MPRILQQSPSWEAKSSTASKEITHILWNPNVHCRVHNSPPPVPALSQIIPVHAFPLYYSKVHLNIILQFTLRSCEFSLYFSFPHQNPVCISFLSHTCHIPRQSHYSWFQHLSIIWWGVTTVSSLLSLSRNSSATYSRTSSAYFLLFVGRGKFYSRKKQLSKLRQWHKSSVRAGTRHVASCMSPSSVWFHTVQQTHTSKGESGYFRYYSFHFVFKILQLHCLTRCFSLQTW